MARMVQGVKLGCEAPGRERQPYPGELGIELALDNVASRSYINCL